MKKVDLSNFDFLYLSPLDHCLKHFKVLLLLSIPLSIPSIHLIDSFLKSTPIVKDIYGKVEGFRFEEMALCVPFLVLCLTACLLYRSSKRLIEHKRASLKEAYDRTYALYQEAVEMEDSRKAKGLYQDLVLYLAAYKLEKQINDIRALPKEVRKTRGCFTIEDPDIDCITLDFFSAIWKYYRTLLFAIPITSIVLAFGPVPVIGRPGPIGRLSAILFLSLILFAGMSILVDFSMDRRRNRIVKRLLDFEQLQINARLGNQTDIAAACEELIDDALHLLV